jgi:homospermidine synthase
LSIDKTVYHHLKGVLCLIGYGACGQGLVPLLKRHLTFDKFVIIDPYQIPPEGTCDKFYHLGLTQENFTKVMGEIF